MIIYHYYQALAPQLPDKLGEMQPLFLAVIAMPVNFAKHSMTFTFREFSGETPFSRQVSSEPGERCYALRTISEAMAIAERTEERWWLAELHRLRGLGLASVDANRTDIEEALREAVDIAERQKSISLARRAEATYTEYGRQQAGA